MKKLLIGLVLAVLATQAMAAMDTYTFPATNLDPSENVTNSVVIRGYLTGVKIVVGNATISTSTVTIASGGRALFTATKVTGTNWYQPVQQRHGQTGTALTYVGSTDSTGTNILYGPIAIAGPVTCSILNDAVITTNTLNEVTLMFDK